MPFPAPAILFSCIFVPVVLALVETAILAQTSFLQEQEQEQSKTRGTKQNENALLPLPPGWVIGVIWVVILGILGIALALSMSDGVSFVLVTAVICACLAYPLYTRVFSSPSAMSIGNKLTLLLALVVALVLAHRDSADRSTSVYFAPLLVWLSYVNIATI
jgi:tryptophan-rich sensory protein